MAFPGIFKAFRVCLNRRRPPAPQSLELPKLPRPMADLSKKYEVLARHMIHESKSVLDWLPQQGVRYQPSLGGTLSLGRTNSFFLGGGRSMLNALYLTAESLGVAIAYDAEVVDLDIDAGMFLSATVRHGGARHAVRAATFVAACGGFESN